MVLPGEGQNALQHVIETVLELDNGHPLVRALSHCGYDDICSVIAMSNAHFDALTYKDDLGHENCLSLMPFGFPIKILQRYSEKCTAQGTLVCDAWWMSITSHHFNTFAETLAFIPTSFPWKQNASMLPLPHLKTTEYIAHAVHPSSVVCTDTTSTTTRSAHMTSAPVVPTRENVVLTSAPVANDPPPVVPTPASIDLTPAPVVPTGMNVVSNAAPVANDPPPVVPTPAPIVPNVISNAAPVANDPPPIVPTPAPIVPTAAPIVLTRAPIVPTRAPVVPTLAPVAPTHVPALPSTMMVDPLVLVSHPNPFLSPFVMFYFDSLDSGPSALSLVHGEDDSVGDPKASISVIAQHERKLDNDGEITAKLLSVVAADNPHLLVNALAGFKADLEAALQALCAKANNAECFFPCP